MRVFPHLCSILLLEAVTLAAPAPEAALEEGHHAPGSPFQGLGRLLRRIFSLETRDEVATYGSYGEYGEYGAYGAYGSYGSYPDTGAVPSSQPSPKPSPKSSPKPATTKATTTITTSITLSVSTTIHPTTLIDVSIGDPSSSHESG